MRITYLFDPLCGWCYGASPALEGLARRSDVTLHLAPTGLFAGDNARLLDANFAAFAWQNDQRIQRLTGQVFSTAYQRQVLAATGARFDSTPATLGVVAVGLSEPARELEALRALQQARYVDGLDNALLSVVADVLSSAGFAAAAHRLLAPDAELLDTYDARLAAARREMARFGAQGVPTLIIEDAKGSRLLPSSVLFGDQSALDAHLQAS